MAMVTEEIIKYEQGKRQKKDKFRKKIEIVIVCPGLQQSTSTDLLL